MKLKSLFCKFKSGLILIRDYFILMYTYKVNFSPHNQHSPTVLFNVSDVRMGSYYYGLMSYFERAGYNLILRHHFWFIANCNTRNKIVLFSLKRLLITCSFPQNSASILYVHDHLNERLDKLQWKKKIYINADSFQFFLDKVPLSEKEFIMPFSLHPVIAHNHKKLDFQSFRNSITRKFRITFSGTNSLETYNSDLLPNYFHKLSLYQTLEAIKNNLNANELYILNETDALSNGGYKNVFLLNDLSQKGSKYIPPSEWLKYLASVDFFLACPGIKMPMCYNTSEAMSVGTILITEYPEFFYPPLKHMKNCIAYHGEKDLIDKIKLVLSLNKETIDLLRENVLNYYNAYLKGESFVRQIEKSNHHQLTLYLQATDVSLPKYIENRVRI
ncbi:MAG: hypothetical protein ACOCWM_03550 [Cyclobacteriaceae bacterium]